jgi:1,4-alpha-glucan branching enzyme
MALRISAEKAGKSKVSFILPEGAHRGPVSVVGNFNNWKPGAHKLVKRSNGTRSVSVTVSPGTELHFRYLGSEGAWFDEPDADEVGADGSKLRV